VKAYKPERLDDSLFLRPIPSTSTISQPDRVLRVSAWFFAAERLSCNGSRGHGIGMESHRP
jgi:hypothetical protein